MGAREINQVDLGLKGSAVHDRTKQKLQPRLMTGHPKRQLVETQKVSDVFCHTLCRITR